MTILFNQPEIHNLIQNGQVIGATGDHSVWTWAAQGSQIELTINGRALPMTHKRQASRLFSWERAGTVRLQGNRHLRLSVSNGVGGIALSSNPRFNPNSTAEVSSTFHLEPNPIQDARSAEVRNVSTPWTLTRYPTVESWEARADHIRKHILVSLGLWPLPAFRPLRAAVFGRLGRDGYSVEKAYFETHPGFFSCGNLYRPLGRKGPFPGIVSPHGHWKNGRVEDGERGSVPARCINLARQGHIVFAYDMAGYNDSNQLVHRGFGGAAEDLWGIGVMGLQLMNGIRAIDFLQSLPEVDSDRIGCTGASGGGTQTFILAAVDDRIKVAAPVNMVSAQMQGGCNCENQSNLRLDINNIEIASCMAPRPLLVVSASGDWTVNTPEIEYLAIREIYRLHNAENRVATAQVDAPHNFNRNSREHVYAWFGKWFLDNPNARDFREKSYTAEKNADLLIYPHRKKPSRILDSEGIVRSLIGKSQRLFKSPPSDRKSLKQFRDIAGTAYHHAISSSYPEAVEARNLGQTRRESFIAQRLTLGRPGEGDCIPAILFSPRSNRKCPATLVVHPEGKAHLADLAKGLPGPLVSGLLKRGHRVLTIDPFLIGESQPLVDRDIRVPHFATYNPTDSACRVQDITTSLAFLAAHSRISRVNLLGLGEAGPWCLVARPLAHKVGRTAIDANRFDIESDGDWVEHLFIPGIRAAGDFKTAVALIAPSPLLIHNTGTRFPNQWIQKAYRTGGKGQSGSRSDLQISKSRTRQSEILDWLTG